MQISIKMYLRHFVTNKMSQCRNIFTSTYVNALTSAAASLIAKLTKQNNKCSIYIEINTSAVYFTLKQVAFAFIQVLRTFNFGVFIQLFSPVCLRLVLALTA